MKKGLWQRLASENRRVILTAGHILKQKQNYLLDILENVKKFNRSNLNI